MIYKQVFDLRGTERQQQIVKEALDAIKFPFERIRFPRGTAIVGWAKLNGQALDVPVGELEVKLLPDEPPQISQEGIDLSGARGHEGDHPAKDTDTEPLTGEVNGRKYTLGVFYPATGNIYVDTALVNYPHLAQTTVSAEVAHAVDEFLPMNDNQREQIKILLHDGKYPAGHECRWWEKEDYGREYYDLVGETFMPLFTYAYSDLPFDGVESFSHRPRTDMADDIRSIIGIERTDFVAPTPKPKIAPMNLQVMPHLYESSSALVLHWNRGAVDNTAVEVYMNNSLIARLEASETDYTATGLNSDTSYTFSVRNVWTTENSAFVEASGKTAPAPVVVEPTPEPVAEPMPMPIDPMPEPAPAPAPAPPIVPEPIVEPVAEAEEEQVYVRYGKSKVFHDPEHYEKKKNAVVVEDIKGLRACKICLD